MNLTCLAAVVTTVITSKRRENFLRPCYFTFYKNITLTEFDDFIGCVNTRLIQKYASIASTLQVPVSSTLL